MFDIFYFCKHHMALTRKCLLRLLHNSHFSYISKAYSAFTNAFIMHQHLKILNTKSCLMWEIYNWF